MHSMKLLAFAAFSLIAADAAITSASAAVCGTSGRSAIAETRQRAVGAASRRAARVAWHYCKRDYGNRLPYGSNSQRNCPRAKIIRTRCNPVQVFNHPGMKCWTKVVCIAPIASR